MKPAIPAVRPLISETGKIYSRDGLLRLWNAICRIPQEKHVDNNTQWRSQRSNTPEENTFNEEQIPNSNPTPPDGTCQLS